MYLALQHQKSVLKYNRADLSEPIQFIAYGFGKNTTGGGDDGTLYTVINLDTSGTGSLQWALEASGSRIVEFDVAGTIDYGGSGSISLQEDNITIKGETAPNGGICVKGARLAVEANNVLCKHVRFRLGDSGSADYDTHLITGFSGPISNIVFDHCSLSWSIDELLGTSTGNDTVGNITYQWCLFSEPLNNSHHSGGNHPFAVLVNSVSGSVTEGISFYRCMIAHSRERNFRVAGGIDIEVINNLIYNFNYASIHGYGSKTDFINNHYETGSNLGNPYSASALIDLTSATGFPIGETQLYFSGSTSNDGIADYVSEFDDYIQGSAIHGQISISDIMGVEDMKADIIANVGATLPKRDAVDIRIINDYLSGSGDVIDSPSEVGGYPDLTV